MSRGAMTRLLRPTRQPAQLLLARGLSFEGGARGIASQALPVNFGVRVVPQQSAWVVERFGKFSTVSPCLRPVRVFRVCCWGAGAEAWDQFSDSCCRQDCLRPQPKGRSDTCPESTGYHSGQRLAHHGRGALCAHRRPVQGQLCRGRLLQGCHEDWRKCPQSSEGAKAS